MNECSGRCCGERADSLTLDRLGRRGGEGGKRVWVKNHQLLSTSASWQCSGEEGGGLAPNSSASAGHCRDGEWPPGAPRTLSTPAIS